MIFIFVIRKNKRNISLNYTVEFDEFVKIMADVYKRKFTDEEMYQAFKRFDTDDSGKENSLFFF